MPEISIIVPVYNVEQYLPAALDSLRAQTCPDWEAILVDDGSPDGCGALCDAAARQDARFRVIHQKNAGVGAARNAGLAAAPMCSFWTVMTHWSPRWWRCCAARSGRRTPT